MIGKSVTHRVTNKVTDRVTDRVTDNERDLLLLLAEDPGYTMPKLSEKMGISKKNGWAKIETTQGKRNYRAHWLRPKRLLEDK